jgi:hypothetical protein
VAAFLTVSEHHIAHLPTLDVSHSSSHSSRGMATTFAGARLDEIVRALVHNSLALGDFWVRAIDAPHKDDIGLGGPSILPVLKRCLLAQHLWKACAVFGSECGSQGLR